MLLERKEVDYAGFLPELIWPAELLAALRALSNHWEMELPVLSIWTRIWLPKAIRAAPITTATMATMTYSTVSAPPAISPA